MAEVWKYFSKIGNEEKAKCLTCSDRIISCKGSSTSGLIRHLAAIHNITVKTRCDSSMDAEEASSSKKMKIMQQISALNLAKMQSLAATLARLVAVDEFPIENVCQSQFIKQALLAKQYNLPVDKHEVQNLLYSYYDSVKIIVIEQIKELKRSGSKFSLTFDEWASRGRHQYLNMNVHTNNGQHFNLGLLRLDANSSVDAIEEGISKKLDDFELDPYKDMVAATTNGGSAVKDLDSVGLFQHQQCYNEGIRLAIIDTIYKKLDIKEETMDDLSEEDTDDENDYERLRPDIQACVKRVRRTIHFFRSSPLTNFLLQNYISIQHLNELTLLLDSKTKWNNIEAMFEQFLNMYNSISKALTDLNCTEHLVDDILPKLNELLNTLKPIRLAVEALGRKDATLLTSEGIFMFLFDALKKQNGILSQELYQAIKARINERRNLELVSLMRYLQNGDMVGTEDLPILPKQRVLKLITQLTNKLFNTNNEDIEAIDMDTKPVIADLETFQPNDLNEKLTNAINASLKSKLPEKVDFNTTIRNEMLIYEGTSRLPENLSMLLEALNTIQPTSTESERAFSCSSNPSLKRPDVSNERLLDVLCFLKYYFLKEEK